MVWILCKSFVIIGFREFDFRSEGADVEDDRMLDAVTLWVTDLQGKDQEAARLLWDRYFERLIVEARKQLGSTPNRDVCEEEVAASVFTSLCRGAENGRFREVGSRDELWRLLVVLTRYKVIDRKRSLKRQKRGSGKVVGESIFLQGNEVERRHGLDALPGGTPSPEFLAIFDEECQRLLGLLRDDLLRSVARFRLEGFSNLEIAEKVRISVQSVDRKLKLIRDTWQRELSD
jgi:DNA-directed RNA polymerase specialized sigma24 family protein